MKKLTQGIVRRTCGRDTDIEFAYDPALTDANPNRPLDLPPTLDGDVYRLPWLRGYGNDERMRWRIGAVNNSGKAANDEAASAWKVAA